MGIEIVILLQSSYPTSMMGRLNDGYYFQNQRKAPAQQGRGQQTEQEGSLHRWCGSGRHSYYNVNLFFYILKTVAAHKI